MGTLTKRMAKLKKPPQERQEVSGGRTFSSKTSRIEPMKLARPMSNEQ
jgi:hypothetical protein